MSKQRPSNHFMSRHFDVLADFCVSGTRPNWKKTKSPGIVLVIATKQSPSFLHPHFYGMRTASILRPNSFHHQTDESENH